MKINTTANNDTRFLDIDPEDLHGDKCGSEVTLDGHINLLMDCEKLGDSATPLTKVTASDINVTPVRVIQ